MSCGAHHLAVIRGGADRSGQRTPDPDDWARDLGVRTIRGGDSLGVKGGFRLRQRENKGEETEIGLDILR